MAQPKQQSDLGSELLLQQGRQVSVLLGLTDELNRDIPLLVHPSVNPTVPSRREFVTDQQLRHVRAPFLLLFPFNLRARRDQVLGPRNGSLVLSQRETPLELCTVVGDLLQPVELLHGSEFRTSA